eukprot:Rhum_TRINITY_DN25670_c0_g1::Rhum_TRINITY_DN25670_c0_g1_i1::g.182440::m.182440
MEGLSREEAALQLQFPEKFDYAKSFEGRVLRIEDDECELSTQQRLVLYALRQQAQHGRNTEPAPSWWNATERAKWTAWTEMKDTSSFEAMVYFVQTLETTHPNWLMEELEYRSPPAAAEEGVDEGVPASANVTDQPVKPSSDPQPSASEGDPPLSPATHAVPVSPQVVVVEAACAEAGAGDLDSRHTLARTPRASDHPPSELTDMSKEELIEQVQLLRYRLSTALKDVQDRDALALKLTTEVEALRAGGLPAHAQANSSSQPLATAAPSDASPGALRSERVSAHRASATPLPAPMPYRVACQAPKKQSASWMSWLVGSDNDSGRAHTRI